MTTRRNLRGSASHDPRALLHLSGHHRLPPIYTLVAGYSLSNMYPSLQHRQGLQRSKLYNLQLITGAENIRNEFSEINQMTILNSSQCPCIFRKDLMHLRHRV